MGNNFITVIKSHEFCTSGAASFIRNRKRRNNELKEADLKVLSEYKKQADDQEFHFHTRQKQLEEKTKALILSKSDANTQDYLLPHPIWSEEEVKSVEIKHTEPRGISDRLAYIAVQIMRKTFDLASGYTIGKHFQTLDERSVLVRCFSGNGSRSTRVYSGDGSASSFTSSDAKRSWLESYITRRS